MSESVKHASHPDTVAELQGWQRRIEMVANLEDSLDLGTSNAAPQIRGFRHLIQVLAAVHPGSAKVSVDPHVEHMSLRRDQMILCSLLLHEWLSRTNRDETAEILVESVEANDRIQITIMRTIGGTGQASTWKEPWLAAISTSVGEQLRADVERDSAVPGSVRLSFSALRDG
jgi:hypothetical protein